ncbi:MAG: RimK family alpha-L-glutamate ligase [bacterium]
MTVLASGFGWHVQDLQRAASLHEINLNPILFQQLSINISNEMKTAEYITASGNILNHQDAILVRMMPPAGLEKIIFRMDMLHRLHESGVLVSNPPRVIEMAVDKALSLSRLASAGICVPATWVGESVEEAMIAFDHLGRDVICKPIFGSEGRGLVRLTDKETAWRVFQSLAQIGSILYLQKYIINQGYDIRIMVLGDQVLAAMKRTAKGNDWRTNIAQGASAEKIKTIDKNLVECALNIADILGGMLIGIDFIYDLEGRIYLLELNGVPGWQALSAVTGVDIASEWLLKLKSGVRL